MNFLPLGWVWGEWTMTTPQDTKGTILVGWVEGGSPKPTDRCFPKPNNYSVLWCAECIPHIIFIGIATRQSRIVVI